MALCEINIPWQEFLDVYWHFTSPPISELRIHEWELMPALFLCQDTLFVLSIFWILLPGLFL